MLPGSASSITPSDLLGLTRFLTGTLDNVSAFSDTNIMAIMNIEYRGLQAKLLAALQFDWKESTVDGTGSGLISLTASDNSYAFPTDMIQIDRIEVNYTGNTNAYVPVTIVPLQGISEAVANTSNDAAVHGTKAEPIAYIRNNVIYLDPIPDATVSGGLKVWGQTLITDLAVGGTAPVFAAPFHELLAYLTAPVWCDSNELAAKGNTIFQKGALKFKEMVEFYSRRNATQVPVLQSKYRSMR